MRRPTPTTVAYDAGYIESHGAETGCSERELWKAVLRQAGEDLFSSDEEIRHDAMSFFESDDLLLVMSLASIDLGWAPALRAKALAIAEASQKQRQQYSRFISHQGRTRSLKQWADVTGVAISTLHHRLRRGWTVERALETPGRQQTTTD